MYGLKQHLSNLSPSVSQKSDIGLKELKWRCQQLLYEDFRGVLISLLILLILVVGWLQNGMEGLRVVSFLLLK